MSEAERPEPDRVDGAPHPRFTRRLYGQEEAEAAVLVAMASGRPPHAWLIAGPRGVGKATLAWRITRSLLAGDYEDALPGSPPTLDVPPSASALPRIEALSEPGLLLLRRAWDDKKNRLQTVITVDEVRRLGAFFALSRPDGGRRVVLVDAADEMNASAANALLKVLEEPPRDATLLLVSHRPGALLPTIRSRCRTLHCRPLDPEALAAALAGAGVETGNAGPALAELSGGSAGEAVRIAQGGGVDLYAELVALLASCPALDRPRALALANVIAGRGSEARLDLTIRLLDIAIGRLARWGAGAPPAAEASPGEADVARRLAPGPAAARAWAELQAELSARARHARAVNLDPVTLILDMVLKAKQTATRTVGQAP